MADIIQLLPDHVANQIAAGEVVQRPASVVKELLENAIDAEAACIKLIVKDGGKALIQVVDDGLGMSVTDARLSFERHATSKIKNAEDLFQLRTKGFRGEALASIAAIAHVEMQTRPEHSETGTRIRIEGSKLMDQSVVVPPKGTSMAVKNLFFNIPARRNFLKSNQVEFRHILDEFHRVALAHPSIAFYLYHNGSELYNLPKTVFKQRIAHVFGGKINERLVRVQEDTQVLKISGYICKPEFAKKSRGEQFFFVNQRFIKSPYLHHAVVAAFEGLIKPDKYPGYFLCLEVDPSSIDINIHPTKTEIKFDDEHTLYALLRSAVKHSLGQFNVAPALDFEQDQNLETPYAYKNKEAAFPRISVDSGFNPFKEGAPLSSARSKYQASKVEGWEQMFEGLQSGQDANTNFSSLTFESDSITGSIFEPADDVSDMVSKTFQMRRKFIVTTIRSGMLVIDQNRAHQRVLYEKFLNNMTVTKATSQQLLFPLLLSFSKADIAVLSEINDSLQHIGFMFNIQKDGHIQITGLPLHVQEPNVEMVLKQLISDYTSDEMVEEGFLQANVLSKALCKSLAVKTGVVLDLASQTALVNDLFACKENRVSPFNKCIYITITESEIDKKFL
ncbi:DNA mismatch repair endonuclease MutL [Arenibacter sp. GZD96]|uniref:DNA mismatch repair endonuclease MutL n=1 Tax=Aurantibrevibacter litoralis TaxID=3106030 RepID=UPI002AFE94B6|nr:DNA mismatch repair endonuclease MutL [Arenibacter sp. GZD-96]MEA1785078.1 DNA mismatch repair endonuclease MutL [Arenibacter sp. GZD-96]